jgi:hypothetical protein
VNNIDKPALIENHKWRQLDTYDRRESVASSLTKQRWSDSADHAIVE